MFFGTRLWGMPSMGLQNSFPEVGQGDGCTLQERQGYYVISQQLLEKSRTCSFPNSSFYDSILSWSTRPRRYEQHGLCFSRSDFFSAYFHRSRNDCVNQ